MARPRIGTEPLTGSERTKRWRERRRAARPPTGLTTRELADWAREHGRSNAVVNSALEDACAALDRAWALLLYGPQSVDETQPARDRLIELKAAIGELTQRSRSSQSRWPACITI
jgi:hypothetical protein